LTTVREANKDVMIMTTIKMLQPSCMSIIPDLQSRRVCQPETTGRHQKVSHYQIKNRVKSY